MNTSKPPRLTKAFVANKLSAVQFDDPQGKQAREPFPGYHYAAAMLSTFDPNTLRPLLPPPGQENEPLQAVLAESTITYDEQGNTRWRLSNTARKRALAQLGNRETLQAALAANPERPDDPQQHILEQYIADSAPPLDAQSLEQLSCTFQVVDWLGNVLPDLPLAHDLRSRIEHERLLNTFRHLAGDHFRGRQAELEMLREYVYSPAEAIDLETLEPSGKGTVTVLPLLLIYGAGGVGKSTLLAKFILDLMEADAEQRIPFVYLDFDRPDLLAHEPITLLVEATRQLGIQYPAFSSELQRLREDLIDVIRRKQLDTPTSKAQQSIKSMMQQQSPVLGIHTYTNELSDALREFAQSIWLVKPREQPLLFVFDTFEEVQYRSSDFVAELWNFLSELQRAIPGLRAIVMGRAPLDPERFPTRTLQLAGLDEEAALGFLAAHDITDPNRGRAIFQQVGGSPLSLWLFTEVLRKEAATEDTMDDPGAPVLLASSMRENLIQGQLYRRILNHIHNPDIRRLAHPGLVLRQVTPELIRDVLAEPCQVQARTLADATALFEELKREVSLVTLTEDGALRHRPDVRRVMLELLWQDDPVRVRHIHQNAIAYYEQHDAVASRAEEIYHRLSLGQQPAEVDPRWQEGVEPYLYNAVEEMPRDVQPYLASYIGVELPEDVWTQTGLENWERRTASRVEILLASNRTERALEALNERAERTPNSPLYALEARTMARLHRWQEARSAMHIALTMQFRAGAEDDDLVELLILYARIDEQLGNTGAALVALAEARMVVEGLDTPQRLLEIDLLRLRLLRSAPLADRAELASLKDGIVAALEQATTRDLLDRPDVLRMAVQQIGQEYPDILLQAIELLGLRFSDTVTPADLAAALADWGKQIADQVEQADTLTEAVGIANSGDPERDWYEFIDSSVSAKSSSRLTKILIQLLNHYPPTERVLSVLADLLHNEQDF